MTIYLGQQAKSLFYMREIPLDSIGVFQCVGGDWIYWYANNSTYDTGFADTEVEAIQKARRHIELTDIIKYDI